MIQLSQNGQVLYAYIAIFSYNTYKAIYSLYIAQCKGMGRYLYSVQRYSNSVQTYHYLVQRVCTIYSSLCTKKRHVCTGNMGIKGTFALTLFLRKASVHAGL